MRVAALRSECVKAALVACLLAARHEPYMLFLLNTRDTFVNEIRVPRPDEVLSSVYRQQVGWGADARRGTREASCVSVFFRVREYNVLLRMTYHSVSHIK